VRQGWPAALLLVGCLHLLTTPGAWLVSDHAEMLFMARRLATAGTLTLAPAGEPLPTLPWVRTQPGVPTRSRLFPGTAVAFAPVVALDRLLGWDDPALFGPLSRLGNHALVLGALALLGASVRRRGASPRAAAMTVVLVGTAWPTWQISRHAGAEPVLAFLVAAFLWTDAATWTRLRTAALVALPWIHPTGCLLAPALALFAVDGAAWHAGPARRDARRVVGVSLLASVASALAVLLVWNQLYHGHFWAGGYAGSKGFFANSPSWLVRYFVSDSLLLAPLPILLALVGAAAGGPRGLRLLWLPLLLLALHLGLFAIFSTAEGQEPARRLASVWFVWGWALGRTWDRLGFGRFATGGLLVMSVLLGFYWFEMREWNYYAAPDGGYYPLVLWVTRALGRQPAWTWAWPVALLAAAGLWAAARVPALPGVGTDRSESEVR